MKLEMILHALDVGGMELMAVRLARALHARGHEVGFTCLERAGSLGESLAQEGYRVSVAPTPGFLSSLRPAALAATLRTIGPDVVHVHSGAWLRGARAARRAGVARVVYTAHGLYPPTLQSTIFDWWAARATDRVIVVSEWLRDHFRRRARVPTSRLSVIPNGIDVEAFKPGPRSGVLRRAFGVRVDDGDFLVGTVARLRPEKNLGLLVRACAALAGSFPRLHAVIVGDGPERPSLERQVRVSGLGDRVHFVGDTRVTPELYRDLDLFVLPSTTEGTSISLLEAMACGVCTVATAVGGNPDVLDGGRCGVLVPSNHVDALTTALATLQADSGRRGQLADLGRRRAVEQFAEERMVERYEEVFRECAA